MFVTMSMASHDFLELTQGFCSVEFWLRDKIGGEIAFLALSPPMGRRYREKLRQSQSTRLNELFFLLTTLSKRLCA